MSEEKYDLKTSKRIEASLRLGDAFDRIEGVTVDKVTGYICSLPTEQMGQLIDLWYIARKAILNGQMYTDDKAIQAAVKQELEGLEKTAEKFGNLANAKAKQTKGKSITISRVKL